MSILEVHQLHQSCFLLHIENDLNLNFSSPNTGFWAVYDPNTPILSNFDSDENLWKVYVEVYVLSLYFRPDLS